MNEPAQTPLIIHVPAWVADCLEALAIVEQVPREALAAAILTARVEHLFTANAERLTAGVDVT